MHAPTPKPFRLPTPRLVLREFVQADLAALHALLSCPRVMEFSPTGPFTLAQSCERLESFIAGYANHGYGKWAVTSGTSGEVMGYCGIELTEIDGPPVPELGFRLRSEFWGRGYGTEAARAVLAYSVGTLHFAEMLAFAECANVRSIHVLTKLGFKYLRHTSWLGHPADIFHWDANTPRNREMLAALIQRKDAKEQGAQS